MKRTVMCNLAVCDTKGGSVFETTATAFEIRTASGGICAATNHFRSSTLAVDTTCDRYDALMTAASAKLCLAQVKARLHAAHQGEATMQTMIFQPKTRVLRLGVGDCPSSKLSLTVINLAKLFEEIRMK